jgi:hypothetical protein
MAKNQTQKVVRIIKRVRVIPKAVKPKAIAKKVAAIVQSKKQSDAEETGRGLSYTLGETHSKFIKIQNYVKQ